MILRWLLRLGERSALIQRDHKWELLNGSPPTEMLTVELSEEAISSVRLHLKDAPYLIYEGPALEVPAPGGRLFNYLRKQLRDEHQSLVFRGEESHLVARGCVVFSVRRAQRRKKYFDYLPQIRLAVRRGDEPTFVKLVPPDARVEGGELYEHTRELDLSIPAGAPELKFYVLREGNVAPRFATVAGFADL